MFKIPTDFDVPEPAPTTTKRKAVKRAHPAVTGNTEKENKFAEPPAKK